MVGVRRCPEDPSAESASTSLPAEVTGMLGVPARAGSKGQGIPEQPEHWLNEKSALELGSIVACPAAQDT